MPKMRENLQQLLVPDIDKQTLHDLDKWSDGMQNEKYYFLEM